MKPRRACHRVLSITFALAGVACTGGVARATAVTFAGSQNDLAASVNFNTSGTNLIVTLTNTSAADVLNPSNVLTAVFFDISGAALMLSRTSAVLAPGSMVWFGTTDPGGVVGGEWAYRAGLSGAPEGADYGISSSGFNLFGPNDLFPGTNLQGPDSPDGLQYGITSAGDNTATGNTPVTGTNALIQNSVVFTLSGLPAGFNPASSISNVQFQYGTDLSEPHFPGVPEPATVVLMAGGAFLLNGRRWLARK